MDNPIYKIFRDDKTVCIQVDTNLKTCSELRGFKFVFENQESAELMARHLKKVFEDWNEHVASNPSNFIWDERLSKVKKDLNECWNGKEHCWK